MLIHSPFLHAKISFGPKLCHVGGRVMQVRSSCFSYLLQYLQMYFFTQWCAETSHLETWNSTKALRPWVTAYGSVSQGLPECSWGFGASSWATAWPTAESALTHRWLGLFSGCDRMQNSTAPSKGLLSMDGCEIILVVEDMGEEHLIQSSCWVHSCFDLYFLVSWSGSLDY